jgi:hypothetical protein
MSFVGTEPLGDDDVGFYNSKLYLDKWSLSRECPNFILKQAKCLWLLTYWDNWYKVYGFER